MTTSTKWQLARAAAERYQTVLTPVILGPFAEALVDFADLQPGETAVDVGCGTGAAARYAARLVGVAGQVAGVDVNASMIEVAKSLPAVPGAAISWHVATAAELPQVAQTVDAVLCAQVLQFMPEKQPALVEMQRIVKPTGRVAISLWTPIEDNPYFFTLVDAVARHIGPETAVGLQSAFAFSNPDDIRSLLQAVGLGQVEMVIAQLDLPMPELSAFVPRHIRATPMGAGFDKVATAVQQAIVDEVCEKMAQFETNGRTQIPFRSHMILCKKET
ncbi:class I SAM-dependent methyltransferase [Candidatus Leptofilum sp.]|uniref:class I SAM-dependent methyltransferase n=1 Tax=Candidatus Leptofilum sp. TaxID=3241576 RepID=UPI003B5CE808